MSAPELPGPIVSVQWLREHLGHEGLRIVDATWQPLASGKEAGGDFEVAHLPGASFLDHRAVADPESPFTDTRPPPAHFTRLVEAAGIRSDEAIVVYSQRGTSGGASRAWWLLRSFGHTNVAVLDGGLPAWVASGGPTEQGAVFPSPGRFDARDDPALVVDKTTLAARVADSSVTVLDARPHHLFAGESVYGGGRRPGAPTPTPGRIPDSHNLPSSAVIDPETRTLRPPAELRAVFVDLGIDVRAEIVTSCSLGIGASNLALAMAVVGNERVAVFDGAWEVWGSDPSTPKISG